jgi:hypothetical protein
MGNGDFAYSYTDSEKAALWDQLGKVMKVVTEGQRPPKFLSDAFQAIIGYDVVERRQRVIQTGEDGKVFLVGGKYSGFREALRDCRSEMQGYAAGFHKSPGPTVFPLMNAGPFSCNEYVRIQPAQLRDPEKTLCAYSLVDPLTAVAFFAQFPEYHRWPETLATFYMDRSVTPSVIWGIRATWKEGPWTSAKERVLDIDVEPSTRKRKLGMAMLGQEPEESVLVRLPVSLVSVQSK